MTVNPLRRGLCILRSFCKVLSAYSQKNIQPRKLHCTIVLSSEKLVRLFSLEKSKRFLGRKMIKLQNFDNLFPPLKNYRSRTTISRENEVGLRVCTT